jgi:hypothetical protein
MHYLIKSYFFKNKSISLDNETINEIKLFKKDQIIIASKNIYIYDIIKNIILLTINLSIGHIYLNGIEILENKRIIIFTSLTNSNDGDFISIYEICKNTNSNFYNCNLQTRLNVHKSPITKLCFNNQLFLLHNNKIFIYGYNTNQIYLVTTFNGFSFNIFAFRNNILGIFNRNEVKFYNTRDYSFEQKCLIPNCSNFNDFNPNIIKGFDLNNNDYILISFLSNIYLYSYKKNSILKAIKKVGFFMTKSIYRINQNEFYLLKCNDIYFLDIKKEIFYEMNIWHYNYGKSIIGLDENTTINNINNEIVFFKKDIFKSLIFEVFIFSFLFLILELNKKMLIKIFSFLSSFYDNNISYYFYYVLEIIFIFVIKKMKFIEEFKNSIRTNNNAHAKETIIIFFLFIGVGHFIFLRMYNSFIYTLVH